VWGGWGADLGVQAKVAKKGEKIQYAGFDCSGRGGRDKRSAKGTGKKRIGSCLDSWKTLECEVKGKKVWIPAKRGIIIQAPRKGGIGRGWVIFRASTGTLCRRREKERERSGGGKEHDVEGGL